MDYVTVKDLRTGPIEVWDRVAAGEELVLTRDGKPFAVVVPTAPSDVEETLRALRLRSFGKAVDQARRQAQEGGSDVLTDAEIEAEVSAVRQSRRASTARGR